MKQKLFIILLIFTCALCLAFAFAGCIDGENNETSNSGSNTQQGNEGDTGSDSGEHVHNYGNLIPEKSATCTEEGLQAHYYCEGCQKYFDSEKQEKTLDELKIDVDSTAHNYGELVPQVDPQCDVAGTKAYYHCEDCGKYFDDQKVEKSLNDLTICALGHILEENQLACKTCGEQLAESLNFELNSDDTCKLTTGTPTSDGKIMIPKIYNGLPVTSIGSSAFRDCTSLTSVIIPDSVTEIGYDVFDNYTNLESVYITDIAAWCNIDFEYGNNPLYYAHNLYLNNQLVTKLTAEMLQGVTQIKHDAFYGCTSLTSVTIGNSVTSIGDRAFEGCENLESITIPNSVTSIESDAFYGCTNLENVYITDIAAWCNIDFEYGNNPFRYAHNLYLNNQLVTELTAEILQGVTTIKDSAFAGCTSLISVTIPDSVTSIGGRAFSGCTSLTSITIGNGVTSIGYSAFSNCDNLESVYITDIAAWCNIDFGNDDSNPLYYAHNLYLNNQLVTELTAEMLQGVTTIKEYVFFGYTSLTSVTIPDSVTTIGDRAFEGCESLSSITIPDSVTSIGSYAFRDCKSLSSITIGNGVKSIGYSAFSGCTSLTSIYITDMKAWCSIHFRYTGIFNEMAFETNYKLYLNNDLVSDLRIPDGITEIGVYVFASCVSLESVTVPSSVTKIAPYAFYNCTSLTSINIDSVTSIYGGAFWGCINLESITVADDNTEYSSQEGILYNKDKTDILCVPIAIKGSVTIPNSVTSIGERAFYRCTNLESINFDDKSQLASIGDEAFVGCTSLTSITIPENVTSIGEYAFEGCHKLVEVVNLSSLPIQKGSSDCGHVAEYAKDVYNTAEFESKIKTQGDYIFYEDGGTVYLLGYKGNNTELQLPDKFGGKTYKIYDYAFYNNDKVTKVTIPDSITSIAYAFRDCTSLESITVSDNNTEYASQDGILYNKNKTDIIFVPKAIKGAVTIPDSVTSIGQEAFYGCTSLRSITIPDSVKSIGNIAFADCFNLTSITIGNGVTSIVSYAFYNCTNLESVYITDIAAWCNISFDNSGANPLYYAHNLYLNNQLVTELTAEMLQGVTKIKKYAFYGCTSLKSVTISDSVTSIGDEAFDGCTNLESITVTENNSAYSSQDGILYNKDKTQIIFVPKAIKGAVTIPNSVTSIGDQAFEKRTGLTSVTIPYSVSSIGKYAFLDCESLTSITIPDSVTSIGERAFYNCTNLKGVYINDIAAWCNIDFGSDDANPLYYAHNLYLNNQLVTELTAEMLQGVTTIKEYAFYDCDSLTSVTIPDSVTSIGYEAFSNCTNLADIIIPDSVTSIGNYAFSGCTNLTSITIPDSVTSIGYSAFWDCTNLESITVADGNTEYLSQEGILYNKDKTGILFVPMAIKGSVTIPNSVTSIGYKAFENCKNLTSITIPDSVTSIGNYAFDGCTSLESVIFENPNGWHINNASVYIAFLSEDLQNTETAATYLTDTYKYYYWKRKTT